MSRWLVQSMLVAVLLPLIIIPGVTPAQAQLVFYDKFEGMSINPDLWHGWESCGSGCTPVPSGPNAEASRKIVQTASGRQLQLSQTTYGAETSDAGGSGGGRLRSRVNNPDPITTFEAVMTIVGATAQACAANPESTRARAIIEGNFFNNGSSSGPGDQTGDVYAGFRKWLDSQFGRFFEAYLFRCDTPDCSADTSLAAVTLPNRTWVNGQRHTMRIVWDPANDKFIFTVNPGKPSQENVELAYTEDDTTGTPLGFSNKGLYIRNTVANCTAGRRKAKMTAQFDNVKVNVGNLSGGWSGTWMSNLGPSGTFSMNLSQQGSSFSGAIDITGSQCGFGTGTLSGSITATGITFGTVFSGARASFTGTVSGSTMSGTYSVTSGPCTGDSGSWNANHL